MTDDILKDLLSDILQQQATILKVVSDLKTQYEKVPLETTKATIQVPAVDDGFKLFANNFFLEFNRGLKQLKNLSDKIPLEVKNINHQETKIVLFSKRLDEGHYGTKHLLNGLYVFLGSCFFIFLLIKYVPIYLGNADENIAYRQTVQWYYYKSEVKNREALINTYVNFKNGDTLYVNELKRFVKNAKIIKND